MKAFVKTLLLLWHSVRMYRLPVSRRMRQNGRHTRSESWTLAKKAAHQKLRSQGRLSIGIEKPLDPQIYQWLRDADVLTDNK